MEAEVETKTVDYQRFLRHTLLLVAPVLDFYRYPLVTAEHHVATMYPVKVSVAWLDKDPEEAEVKDEQGFKDILKRVFADEETRKIIGALLAQSLVQQQASP